MQLLAVGGIFWRLDTSGNLTAYNTIGTTLANFNGSIFTSRFGLTVTVGGSGTTTSTSYVSTGGGMASSFTPVALASSTGLVTAFITASHSVANAQFKAAVFGGTESSPPALGTSVGTDAKQANSEVFFTLGPSTQTSTLGWAVSVGMTIGSANFFYIGVATVTAGTLTLGTVNMQFEVGG